MSTSLADFLPTHVPVHVLLTLRRTGEIGKTTGMIFGELTIGEKSWVTMERGHGYTYARKGGYNLEMVMKIETPRPAIRFVDKGVQALMIHDAAAVNDIKGCIAPGLGQKDGLVTDSVKAMGEIFDTLGGWAPGKKLFLTIENNALEGDRECSRDFIKRRVAEGKL